jgi:hypothetical protein
MLRNISMPKDEDDIPSTRAQKPVLTLKEAIEKAKKEKK